MSWSLFLGKNPRPKPKGKGDGKNVDPSDKPTPPAEPEPGDGAGSDVPAPEDGGLLQSLGGWLWDHPVAILVLLVAALIGVNYLWSQFRKKQMERGVAVRPLGPIVRDIVKFAVKEDKRPVHGKTPWLRANRLYGILALLTVLSVVPGLPTIPPLSPVLVLWLVLGARYSKIAKARKAIVSQMFAVANGECRYPKGAELNPWGYVNVTGWSNLIQPGQTIISIPAAYQSEDMKTREKFERNFNGTVSEENAWTYKWESAKNRIVCEPAAFLPNMAAYPGPGDKWDEIPIGVKGDGTQAIIPLSVTPHTLVCGPTGSGKSVLQRSVLFHILAHSDTWRLVAIDMKKVEMAWLKKYPQVLKVATDLEEAVEVLRSLRAEMMRRYEEMEQAGVNHAKDLPDPPKAIFCMIDESTVLLAPEGIKSDEGKERDELHAEAGMIIGELGRLSRASMIHVMACFQRPDATFLKGETKANFDARIAAGRMDTTPSLMVLDSEAANRLPKIKGRGMVRIGGELDTFQGFFAEQSWFDEWVAQQEAAARGETVAGEVQAAPEAGPKKRLKAPKLKKTEQDAEPFEAPISDGLVESDAPVNARKGGGLKGLAAKAAAKAEARAARLDAEAAAETALASGPTEAAPVSVSPPSAAPAPAQAPVPPAASPVPAGDDFERGEDLDEALGPPPMVSLDFDDEDYDGDEDYDEDEYADEDDPDQAVPDPEPEPERPVVPQPVEKPSAVYRPGMPLPDYGSVGKKPAAARPTAQQPATAPQRPAQPPAQAPQRPHAAPQRPAQTTAQAPQRPHAAPQRPAGGIPVRPPAGLPVRPPAPPKQP